jgi:hypothetical protein
MVVPTQSPHARWSAASFTVCDPGLRAIECGATVVSAWSNQPYAQHSDQPTREVIAACEESPHAVREELGQPRAAS